MFAQNLAIVQLLNPQLWRLISNLHSDKYRSEPSRSGRLTLIYHSENDNQDYYIHSRFKPEAEALKLVQKANLNTDHIIIFGLGLGYHLELIMTHKPEKSRVLLVEPELEILKHSMNVVTWENLWKRQDFFYCFGTDLNLLASAVQQFIDVATFDSVEIIELPSEVRFLNAYFSAARQRIDSEIKTLLYDFKTRLAEDSMVPRNILKNIKGILHTRPVKSLKNRFPGKPGFIVSAGPSLDKNILYLKKINNRGAVICVDTALKPLLKRGIHPHFTITADPSYKNYLHLQGTEQDIKYFLVADTGISTQVYEDFRDHMFSVSLGKPILKMMEQNIGEIGEIEAWGSVISMALNFAIYLGLDPIVFLGQDFAFTEMRNHCRGTSWEDTWLEYTRDLDMMQRREKQSITGIAKMVEVPDIYNRKTMSSDRLMLYKNYLTQVLASCPAKRFINATEGGILREIENKSLHQVLEEYIYHREGIDFKELFKIPVIYNPQNKKQLLTFFKAKLSFFKKYKKKLNDAIARLDGAENMAFSLVSSLLEQSQNLRNSLYANVRNGEIVEMWSQGPIYEFLKGYGKLEKQGFNEASQIQWVQLFREYFKKLLPYVSGIIASFDSSIKKLQ